MPIGYDDDAFEYDDLSQEQAQKYAKQKASTADRLGGGLAGGMSGAATGAQLGTMAGPEGTAIGAGVGGLLGLISGVVGAEKDSSARSSQSAMGGIDPLKKALKGAKSPFGLGDTEELGDFDFLDETANMA